MGIYLHETWERFPNVSALFISTWRLMRICTICNERKTEDLFERKNIIKNSGRCKACKSRISCASQIKNHEKVKRSHKKWRDDNIGHVREKSKEYQRTNKERISELKRKHYKENQEYYISSSRRSRLEKPEQTKAHNAVKEAIRKGQLRRLPCEKCGETNDVHGHHDDYNKPLEVIWLCRSCHIILHKTKRIYE